MAKDRNATTLASVTSSEHGAYHAGDKVEWNGKLGKVIQFGFLELPSIPGQELRLSDGLVAHLQLPADSPGGKPNYAYFVPADEMTSLKDDPKKQRALEREFNPLFGDPAPVAEDSQYNKPEMAGVTAEGRAPSKDSGKATRSGAAAVEGITSRRGRAPIDMARATDTAGDSKTAKVVTTEDTEKPAAKKSAAKSAPKSAPAKSSKKSEKKAR